MNYQKINNILGWVVFAIASYVFLSTIEPTASFWDCGEFIATAVKLEVGHPPGAPLFMMLGRVVSLFTSDVTKMAMYINGMSAVSSAFCILFLFWSITAIAKKMLSRAGDELTTGNILAIMGSGLVGSLAYTFSDSFWFSAVEGEVYAMSSFFTAFVVWAILKWEQVADKPSGDRWLVLIAYMMGLSIGVHLLNLLTIPAMALVYYFKKYNATKKGTLIAFIVGGIVLVIVQYGIIPGLIVLASKFDLLFVNTLGMPFGSGIIFYAILIIVGIIWGLKFTIQKNQPLINTAILCFTVILLGYSSYAMILIRSDANTPMDENNPENIFTFLSYLNREQYGDRPLAYGQYYNAKQVGSEEGDMTYYKGEDRYEENGRKITPTFDPKNSGFFPRMWSNQAHHVRSYKYWADIKHNRKPTFAENIKFMFNFQFGWMWGRYFMWNFVGRQNDIQGHGDNVNSITDGNWLSGIKFIDEMRLDNQSQLYDVAKNNKARNTFFFLPLLLGLVGFFFQMNTDKKSFLIVGSLFFLTGLAIQLYLNPYPYQPRERDYAYVGSYYAFAMWIGLGVLGIYKTLQKFIPSSISAIATTLVCLFLVPGVMAKQGWDDHDRSGAYTARDFARNYLDSCEPNAILFTNGDNDTFPLWYVQEVEGYRTDVRVVNLSLLNTDWYINQMRKKAYESEGIPVTVSKDSYRQGNRDYVQFYDKKIAERIEAKQVLNFIFNDDQSTQLPVQGGKYIDYFPTRNLKVTVDVDKAIKAGVIKESERSIAATQINWDINKSYLFKADLILLDLIANNDWSRPIYFAITVGGDSYLNLEKYFRLEGLAYRFVPIENTDLPTWQTGKVNAPVMYNLLMNKFKWGGLENPNVYLNENNLRMTMNFRNNFNRLAEDLLVHGKKDSAIAVLNKCLEVMPNETVPFDYFMLQTAEMYYKAGAIDKAAYVSEILAERYDQELKYYFSLKDRNNKNSFKDDKQRALAILQQLISMAKQHNQTKFVAKLEPIFQAHSANFQTN